MITTVAYGAGGSENTTEFYSDAAHTKLVGEIITGCGSHGKWGKTTVFSEHSSSPCDGLRVKNATSIAATSLMHSDPVGACHLRCLRIPLQSCHRPRRNSPSASNRAPYAGRDATSCSLL